jgi:tetratricopeptide (TPR) repeat protein
MKCQLLLLVLALLTNGPATAGEDQSSGRPVPTNRLWGRQYAEASAATSRADLVRAELEKRMPAGKGPPARKQGPSPTPGEFDAEVAAVERAYQEVIDRYPHTEFAMDCAMGLCGLYQYQGKYDEAAELSAKTADEFAGTWEGRRAALNTGWIYANALGDYAQARTWFLRIPKPEKPPGAPYDREENLYLAAQEQLMACEVRLGRDSQAEKRSRELREAFPQYSDQLERSFRFEVASRDLNAKKPMTVSLETLAKFLIGFGLILIVSGLCLLPAKRCSQKGQ